MADGKLYITISDKRPRGENGADYTENDTQEKKESSVGKYVAHRFFHYVDAQAQKIVMTGINNIGNFTGDYNAQRAVLNLVEMGRNLLGAGIAIASQIAAQNYPGAIMTAVFAVTSESINIFSAYQLNQREMKKLNYSTEQLKDRSGLNSYIDGSRGTQN